MDSGPSLRPLTAREFFALKLDGGSKHRAHLATGLAYTTVCRAESGGTVEAASAALLERWSRELPAAQQGGVYLSAAHTLGVAGPAPEAA